MQYSTIGEIIHPGFEVKIYCSRNTDRLESGCLSDRYRIALVKEGSGIFTNGSSSQIVTSPAVLCLNEQDNAELYDTAGIRLDVMYFEPTCFARYVTFENLEAWKNSLSHDAWFFRPFFDRTSSYIGVCPVNRYTGNRVSQLIEQTDRELSEQRDDFWPCRSRSFFIELLMLSNSIYDEGELHEKIYFGKMTDEIKEVIDWLHTHYIEKITMEVLTRQFSTNKTTLNQKFKAVMGTTVTEYIHSIRMQAACSFLRKTYLPIKEIVQRAGYKDDSHFLRTFKKHIGCSPSEYRNRFDNT